MKYEKECDPVEFFIKQRNALHEKAHFASCFIIKKNTSKLIIECDVCHKSMKMPEAWVEKLKLIKHPEVDMETHIPLMPMICEKREDNEN